MKKYVFLTFAIGGMGGSQMYIRNKADYLRNHGWTPIVLYFQDFDLKIDYFQTIESYFIKDFRYKIPYTNVGFRNQVLEKAAMLIADFDSCIVESHSIPLSMWAELLCKRVGGTHILNPIEEELHPLSDGYANYLEFKLFRHEMINSSENTLKRLFRQKIKLEYLNYCHKMVPYCSNVIDYQNTNAIEIKDADYTILSIGRLDKPYIISMVDDIRNFANEHKKNTFNVIFIGASTDGHIEAYIENQLSLPHLKVYLLGYVFPIPVVYIEKADVSIACANSILVSANQGVPTICIDAYDHKAIGVYGHDTKQLLRRHGESIVPVSELLDSVLFSSKYPRHKYSKADNSTREMEQIFSEQLQYAVNALDNKHQYFNVCEIYNASTFICNNIKRLVRTLLRK